MSYKKAHFFTPLKYSRIQNPHKNENKNTAMIINSFKLPLINKYLQIKKKSSLFINKNKLSKKLKIILKRYVFFTPLLESSNLVISRVNFNKKNKQILQYINKKLKPTSNYINLVKTAQCSSFFNLNNIFIRRKKNFNSKFKIKLNFK
jgi:hypothetical protein